MLHDIGGTRLSDLCKYKDTSQTGRQLDGRAGNCHIDCVSNRQIISLVCWYCVEEELSPQDFNCETMATVGVFGDEKEQQYKSWILLGLGRHETQIKAFESLLICQLTVPEQ